MINLADYSLAELRTYFQNLGEPSYRAQQLVKWVYQLGVRDFSLMSNFSLKLKKRLLTEAKIVFPEIIKLCQSQDGTKKWLFRLFDGELIETVYIPEKNRGTLCCSTQVGCSVGCVFCATGKMGFRRNLSSGEIIGQLAKAIESLSPDGTNKSHIITNIVFMGMGEPLLNYSALNTSLELMLNDHAYGLSKYRITVSTSGFLPGLKRLQKDQEVAVALSLHATTDILRDYLIPLNQNYKIDQLISFLDNYFTDKRRFVTIEYLMIHEKNDFLDDAHRLVKILRNGKYKVNLIPANIVEGVTFTPSSLQRIDNFRNYLLSKGVATITRKSRGQDIMSACGQLITKYDC